MAFFLHLHCELDVLVNAIEVVKKNLNPSICWGHISRITIYVVKPAEGTYGLIFLMSFPWTIHVEVHKHNKSSDPIATTSFCSWIDHHCTSSMLPPFVSLFVHGLQELDNSIPHYSALHLALIRYSVLDNCFPPVSHFAQKCYTVALFSEGLHNFT